MDTYELWRGPKYIRNKVYVQLFWKIFIAPIFIVLLIVGKFGAIVSMSFVPYNCIKEADPSKIPITYTIILIWFLLAVSVSVWFLYKIVYLAKKRKHIDENSIIIFIAVVICYVLIFIDFFA